MVAAEQVREVVPVGRGKVLAAVRAEVQEQVAEELEGLARAVVLAQA